MQPGQRRAAEATSSNAVVKVPSAAAPAGKQKTTSSSAAAPAGKQKITSSSAAAPAGRQKTTSSSAAAPAGKQKPTSSSAAAAAGSKRTKRVAKETMNTNVNKKKKVAGGEKNAKAVTFKGREGPEAPVGAPFVSGLVEPMPLDTVVVVPADLAILRNLARTIEQRWWNRQQFVFGCAGKGEPIMGLCANNATSLDYKGSKILAIDAMEKVASQFANKLPPWNRPQGCGTSNCHSANVAVVGDALWQTCALALLKALQQDTPSRTVASRAPKKIVMNKRRRVAFENKQKEKIVELEMEDAFEEFDELMLTLYGAHKGITPPVHLAYPVHRQIMDGKHKTVLISRAYGYLLEDGWTDVSLVLDQKIFEWHSSEDEQARARASIAKGVLTLLREISKLHLVTLDAKHQNMVARCRGDSTDYEVRMIDFAAMFTVDVNMYAPVGSSTASTSADCVFFINGILFLNVINKEARKITRLSFKGVAKEVLELWDRLQHEEQGFCHLLSKDKTFPHDDVELQPGSLTRVPLLDFLSVVRENFYVLLEHYSTLRTVLGFVKTKEEIDKQLMQNVVAELKREYML